MAAAHTLRVGLVQHACPVDRAPQGNVDRAVELIRQAAARGAELVVTQEMFTSRYFPQTEDAANFALAESIPGPTTDRLCGLAKELGIEISASLFERRAPGLFHNSTALINSAGQIVGVYRKMHIPDDPRFYEKYYFAPGDAETTSGGGGGGDRAGFQAHALRKAKVGLLICWDQWYPEAARLTALRGAQVLLYPTAIGWHREESDAENQRQREAWITIQRSHAIANGLFVVAVNRVGVEQDLRFWGSSFVADPMGQIIAQASGEQEEVLVVDCDLSQIEVQRTNWPFLRDRRIDAYSPLLRRMDDGT
ncbi:MAG: carbon-nitrogen hydrolase [Phycisphaeraceae bacterium]|nr:carbon-nitrogen hydrolase [Phycisphaeraceae bacterium]